MKKHWSAYLYVAPAAIAMTALTAIPFVVGAAVSLFAYRDGSFTFVGMATLRHCPRQRLACHLESRPSTLPLA